MKTPSNVNFAMKKTRLNGIHGINTVELSELTGKEMKLEATVSTVNIKNLSKYSRTRILLAFVTARKDFLQFEILDWIINVKIYYLSNVRFVKRLEIHCKK